MGLKDLIKMRMKTTHISPYISKQEEDIDDSVCEDSLDEASRFELIDAFGRALVYYGPLEYSLQDDGQTLKVFINKNISGNIKHHVIR